MSIKQVLKQWLEVFGHDVIGSVLGQQIEYAPPYIAVLAVLLPIVDEGLLLDLVSIFIQLFGFLYALKKQGS